MIFAPGFLNDASKSNLASELLKITFPYIFFISLTAFAGGILNTYKHFAIPAFTPVLLNISLIACAIWLAPLMETPIKALAWAVLIAGFVQLLFQAPFLLKIKKFPRPSLKSDQDGVRRILKLMLPILFAVSIVQINLLIDTLIASFLTTGSISWLYFSDRLVEFPLGVFGIALATAVLPNLSEKHAQGSSEKFSDTLDWSMRCIFLIALPATIGLAMLAAPLLITLFNYKEFSILDVLMTSYSLKAYAIGLPAFVLIKVLSAGFFSRQDTKTPVKIGLIAVVANIVLNILLVWLFNYINLAHVGLALATSLSAYLQAFLLFRKLKKIKVYRSRNKWLGFIAKIILALAVMIGIIMFGVDHVFVWISWDVFDRILNLMLWVLVSMLSYFSVLWLTGLRLRNITTLE
jgi:putative peptidoglycan lipid II flippase